MLATADAHGLYRGHGFREVGSPEIFMERNDAADPSQGERRCEAESAGGPHREESPLQFLRDVTHVHQPPQTLRRAPAATFAPFVGEMLLGIVVGHEPGRGWRPSLQSSGHCGSDELQDAAER